MNMGKAVSELAERQQSNAQMRMQYSMTSINNLALLLNESLEDMQKQAKERQSQQPQSMLQALQKNVLAQILEAAKTLVQSRMKEILQSAERLASQNSKLAAQRQQQGQQALNAQTHNHPPVKT
jgi:hypothetical protein